MTLRNVGFALGIVALSSTAFAQKNNVTNAAVEYNKFKPALQSGDMEEAQKVLEIAKGFIDQAAVHADTKDWDKTNLYVGRIYGGLAVVEGMKETSDEAAIMANFERSIQGLNLAYSQKGKYFKDVQETAQQNALLLGMAASQAYEGKEYKDAGDAFDLAARYNGSIGMLDTTNTYNSALSYRYAEMYPEAAARYMILIDAKSQVASNAVEASKCYEKMGDFEKAKSVIRDARITDPNDKELLTQLVNVSLSQGDNDAAKQALSDAIKADPNNPQLHYIIGTIHMNMKDNAAAETSLRKALELDPKFVNAQYQLGAHLYNWASQLKEEASFLKIGDPKEGVLLDEADEKMKGAIEALELYIANEPNDKIVLDILYKAHHKQGNTEKAAAYKKRLDAL